MPPIKIVIADGEDNEDVSSSGYVMCIAYLYGLYSSDYSLSLSNLFYITIVLHLGGDQSIWRRRRYQAIQYEAYLELSIHNSRPLRPGEHADGGCRP